MKPKTYSTQKRQTEPDPTHFDKIVAEPGAVLIFRRHNDRWQVSLGLLIATRPLAAISDDRTNELLYSKRRERAARSLFPTLCKFYFVSLDFYFSVAIVNNCILLPKNENRGSRCTHMCPGVESFV